MFRSYLESPGRSQIHCRHAGSDGPWIFLIHQFPFSCRQFERVIPGLGKSSRAFALDVPGYGVSPEAGEGLSVQDYASHMIGAIDSLGADRFAIVGIETGAAIAVEIIKQTGNRGTHAILLDVPPLSGPRRRKYVRSLGQPSEIQNGRHLLREWRRYEKRWGPTCDVAQLRMAVSETFYVYGRYHWGINAFARYDLGASLSLIACPTLFVFSAASALSNDTESVVSVVKGAQSQTLNDVSPTLCWTAPDRLVSVIQSFVNS